MTAVPDAWRHSALDGWVNPALDDIPELPPVAAPRAANAIGVDVSGNNAGPWNWQQVAASGRSFTYVKATGSTQYVNPNLDAQYQGAVSAGLSVGAYHFADPSQSPEGNADNFARQVNRLGAVAGHLPPCLDIETGTGDLAAWTQRFITRLRAATGCVRTMVYSSTSFFANQIREDWMDSNIALWMAHPGQPPGQPGYLTPRVSMHQYSWNGQVSGLNGNICLDYAIWPLSTLIPGTVAAPPVMAAPPPASGPSDLTADEQAMLTAVYQQMSGSPTVGSWPGWPSWPQGSGRSLTLVDYARQADSQLVALAAQLAATRADLALLKAQGVSAPASLSDADKTAIALAVVTMLTQRLAS